MSVRPDAAQRRGLAHRSRRRIIDAIQRLGGARATSGRSPSCSATNSSASPPPRADSLVLPTRPARPSSSTAAGCSGRACCRRTSGVVVALGGQPIELVLASDIDVRFLQATLEPRYVLRVFERLVLRIKELDAVCVRHDRCAPTESRRSSRGGHDRDLRPACPAGTGGLPAAVRAAQRQHDTSRHGRHPHRPSRRPRAGADAPGRRAAARHPRPARRHELRRPDPVVPRATARSRAGPRGRVPRRVAAGRAADRHPARRRLVVPPARRGRGAEPALRDAARGEPRRLAFAAAIRLRARVLRRADRQPDAPSRSA